MAGLKTQMSRTFGPNLLCDTGGGGIENVGMSRAVSEMLLSAPSLQWIELYSKPRPDQAKLDVSRLAQPGLY